MNKNNNKKTARLSAEKRTECRN